MLRYFSFFIVISFGFGCGGKLKETNYLQYKKDSAEVFKYIIAGNNVYAKKSGYEAFAKSMLYFDSAYQISEKTDDSLLLASSYFAIGRAYDAWNKEPEKTIAYYKIAASYYSKMPDRYLRSLYLEHLVAHSYDKIKDSVNTVNTLKKLYDIIVLMNDSVKRDEQMEFIPELALISTEVGNYQLAGKILDNLIKREWIINQPESYDYLYHYYMSRARIDIFGNKKNNSVYLDSIKIALKNCKNLSDSLYYSDALRHLYRNTTDSLEQIHYFNLWQTLDYKMNNPIVVASTQKKFDELEKNALEKEMLLVKEKASNRKILAVIMAVLTSIITVLGIYLYKKNQQVNRRKEQLSITNQKLEESNLQNELLNHEIHHRVKNNLQMILSLVSMQEFHTENPETLSHLQEIKQRIESIAALHHQLIEHNEAINMKEYISDLVTSVVKLVKNNSNVVTHLEIEEIKLRNKISFPLGLILNECITNSIKYAKPENDILQLYLNISKKNDKVYVHYKDSGVPQKIKSKNGGLGLSIINLLGKQMGAKTIENPDNVFEYTFYIPLKNE